MFPKALASGAEIVRLELAGGIAPQGTAMARALVAEPPAEDGVECILWNEALPERGGLEEALEILASYTPPPVVMTPEARVPEELVLLDQLLTGRGHALGHHVIIESN
jgi:hypothetical protein